MVGIKCRIIAKPQEGTRPIYRNRNGKNTSTSIPNVNQSAGQDGLLGMEFDPNYNNTHHIFRSVRLEQLAPIDVSGYGMNKAAKITFLTSASREQTETLFGLFKKVGANVVLHFQENSGHELGYDEISTAKDWLSNLPRYSP